MKEKLDKNQKTLVVVRQKFSDLIDNYFQVKRNLDNAHNNLAKDQQMRCVIEMEHRVSEKSEIIPTIERVVNRDITCYQKILMNLEEEVAQTQNEIRELSEQQFQIRSKLKLGFLEYCKKINSLSLYNDKFVKMLLEFNEDESLGIIRRKFNKFQRTMIRNLRVNSCITISYLYLTIFHVPLLFFM
ncbi:uncharacterized protein LOC143183181 [Calliopsis andreniformis]|uniref:uncharacterized protein LOC143183181 n=1 Tax=Calliopsis andreniformis TaxID=337506 RepID=UPI003FCD04AF